MRRLSTLAEAVNFAVECESLSRYADAEALYLRLLEVGVDGSLEGTPAEAVVCEGLIRSAMRTGRFAVAADAFDRLLRWLAEPRDAEFDRIYRRGLRLTQTNPLPVARMYRFFELSRLLASTHGLEGEVAECGCFRGLSAYVIAHYLAMHSPGFTGHGFHVFDSFAGLSEPGAEDRLPAGDLSGEAGRIRRMARAGHFSASLEEVRAALAEFPGIGFHAGWIPQSFVAEPERRYRFVHVDVDLYAPTLASLEYFHPRLVAGGIILSDDYGWPGARQAMDEYAGAAGARLEVNAHLQAVIRKP